MPCFRGIGLSIAAVDDDSIFPEFPHPDGSSAPFRNFSADNNDGTGVAGSTGSSVGQVNPVFLSPRLRRKTSAAAQHADPTVSVYIPSSPDANFYFRYTITQPPADAKYLFFKVAINGCYVVSWGINPAKTATGTTRHALFEPSERYQHNDNGVLMTEYGIESRCFRFVSSGAGVAASVADDGGLIEVRVLRAKARRRRAAQPGPCRGGDRYGVALVSNGLLDHPCDARYYDYHLLDAKDAPYASFCFHYRSWDNLRLLHLAPCKNTGSLKGPLPYSEKAPPPLPIQSSRRCELEGFDFEPRLEDWGKEDCDSPSGRKSRLAYFQLSSGTATLLERPAAKREGRPLPDPPVSATGKTAGQAVCEYGVEEEGENGDKEDDQTTSDAGSLRVYRSRGASVASISSSLCAYANGDDGLTVDTIELGSATKLEAIFHGRLSEKWETKSLAGVPVTSSHRAEPQSQALVVYPFTDSPRKREVRSPTPNLQNLWQPDGQKRQKKPHIRGFSHDLSPTSRGSPRPRRPHGGSLDCDYPFLRSWDLAAASASHGQAAGELCFRPVVLTKSTPVGQHVRLLRLQIPADAPDVEFAPGQWVDTFCPGIPKAGGFTITSAPSRATSRTRCQERDANDSVGDGDDDDATHLRYLELAIKRAPENPAAAWLWGEEADRGEGQHAYRTSPQSPLGQTLHVRVGGSFVWPPRTDHAAASPRARYVFVAGGVGINPIMSMVSALAESDAEEAGSDRSRRSPSYPLVHVLYSVHSDAADLKTASEENKGTAAVPENHGILFLSRLATLFGRGAVRGRLALFLTGGSYDAGRIRRDTAGVPCVVHRRVTTADLAAAVRGDGLDGAEATDRVFVYVCGVPAMTDAFVAYLTASPTAAGGGLGLPPEQVIFEKWW